MNHRVDEQPDVAAEAGELYAAMAAQERRVLSFLISHRRIAAPIVKAAGLEMRHFECDDHRLIFAGWLIACEENLRLIPMLRLIRRGLQADGFWDLMDPPCGPGAEGSQHSDGTLARIATAALTADEYRDAMAAVGENGDWLSYAISRHVIALVGAAEMIGGVA